MIRNIVSDAILSLVARRRHVRCAFVNTEGAEMYTTPSSRTCTSSTSAPFDKTQLVMSSKPSSSHGVRPPEGDDGVLGASALFEERVCVFAMGRGVTRFEPKDAPIPEGVATEAGDVGGDPYVESSADSTTAVASATFSGGARFFPLPWLYVPTSSSLPVRFASCISWYDSSVWSSPASSALIARSPPRALCSRSASAACLPSTKETNNTASARLTAKKAPMMIMDVKYTHDHGLTASFA